MQNEKTEHIANHYHALVLELQAAKKSGHIDSIQFLERDILVLMNVNTSDEKLSQVADHISKKYRIWAKVNIVSKTITVFDVYCLDPRV